MIQCPCHSWEDGRETYSGDTWLSHDTDETLRLKFTALALGTVPFGLAIRLPLRLLELALGSWMHSYEQANEIFYQRTYEWTLRGSPPDEAPTRWTFARIYVGTQLILLAEEIAKCATLPFALIALTFAALWGLINPLDGRKLYGQIERMWTIPLSSAMPSDYVRAVNYLAICMQTRQVWNDENLFRYAPGYQPTQIRSLQLRLMETFAKSAYSGDAALGAQVRSIGEGIQENDEAAQRLRTEMVLKIERLEESVALRNQLVDAALRGNNEIVWLARNALVALRRLI